MILRYEHTFEKHRDTCMGNCFYNFLRFNGNFVTKFFILADNFAISSCCVVIYQNITSDTSTIIRYKNVQEKTVRYVKKIVAELGNTIFIIKFKI